MKLRLSFFILGLVLLLLSIFPVSKMIIETIYEQNLSSRYEFNGNGFDSMESPSAFSFYNQKIEVAHTNEQSKIELDTTGYKVYIADIVIRLNGKTLDTLKGYDVRWLGKSGKPGLGEYFNQVAFVRLKDKKENKEQLAVIVNTSRENDRISLDGKNSINSPPLENKTYHVIGSVPLEKNTFRVYLIDKNGQYIRQDFSYLNRNGLQTRLAQLLSIGSFGYYTNAFHYYPSLFYPLLYPYLTFALGLLFTFLFFPRKSKNKKTTN